MTKAFIRTEYDGTYYPVVAHEHVATNTGILDANGNPIYRQPRAVGFVTDFSQHKPVVRVKAKGVPT